MIKGYLNW